MSPVRGQRWGWGGATDPLPLRLPSACLPACLAYRAVHAGCGPGGGYGCSSSHGAWSVSVFAVYTPGGCYQEEEEEEGDLLPRPAADTANIPN